MKYEPEYSKYLGKTLSIIAETPEERKALKIMQEIACWMGFNCGAATTGHSPYFNLRSSGVGPQCEQDELGSLEFTVVTLSHEDAKKQELRRSKKDRNCFLTYEERRERDKE